MTDYALLEIRTTVLDDNNDEQPVIFDLLYGADGFIFDEWTPSVAQYKDDGVFQNSPFADGRKLVFRRFANAVETIKLKQHSDTTDGSASVGQDLIRLLEKAADYRPSGFSSFPVYLAFLPREQTEIQYALIVAGKIPELQDPMTNPFFGSFGKKQNSVWEISLILEREHWTENPPEQGTAVPIYATQEFNGSLYGNVDDGKDVQPVTTPDVFMANKHVYSNITNRHRQLADVNQINGPLPFNMLEGNLYSYYGVDSSIAGSCQFSSLIFDISTLLAGSGLSLDLEYWNGAAWTDLSLEKDNTVVFSVSGVNGIFWVPPSDWVTSNPGGAFMVTGWWIRFRILGTVTQSPFQQNRIIYTVSWPYLTVDKGVVGGEIEALMRAFVYDGTPSQSSFKDDELQANWVMLATRRVNRGEDFTPYINVTFTDEDRPANTAVTGILAPGLAPDTILNSPTGRSVSWSSVTLNAVDVLARVGVRFSSVSPTDNIAAQWAGRYRVFLRVIQVGGNDGDMIGKLSFKTEIPALNDGVTFHETKEVALTNTGVLEALDFGEVTIKENLYGFSVLIWLGKPATSGGGHVLHMCDLVLMPVDEYSAVVDARGAVPYDARSLFGDSSGTPPDHVHMEMDGITQSNETRTISAVTGGLVAYPLTIVSGRHQLTHKHQLRMWSFMQFGTVSGASVAIRSKLEKNQQYLTYRGKE